MKIKVFPPPGCSRECLDERGWMYMPEGSTVSDVLRAIHCNKAKAKLLLCSLNGERTKFSAQLKDGDVIGFFFPVAGG